MTQAHQTVPIQDELTVDQALRLLDKYNASLLKMIPRDDHDQIIGAVIVVSRDAASDVLRVIGQLEKSWENEDAEKTQPHNMT